MEKEDKVNHLLVVFEKMKKKKVLLWKNFVCIKKKVNMGRFSSF